MSMTILKKKKKDENIDDFYFYKMRLSHFNQWRQLPVAVLLGLGSLLRRRKNAVG